MTLTRQQGSAEPKAQNKVKMWNQIYQLWKLTFRLVCEKQNRNINSLYIYKNKIILKHLKNKIYIGENEEKEGRCSYFNFRKVEFNEKKFYVCKEGQFILIKMFTIKMLLSWPFVLCKPWHHVLEQQSAAILVFFASRRRVDLLTERQ